MTSKNTDFYSKNSTDKDNTFFSIFIYADNKIQIIQRSYTKLSDLLARLGGVLQSLIILGSIFIYLEYSLLLKNTILNALFSFKKPKTKPKEKNKIKKPKNKKINEVKVDSMNIQKSAKDCKSQKNGNFVKFPVKFLYKNRLNFIKKEKYEIKFEKIPEYSYDSSICPKIDLQSLNDPKIQTFSFPKRQTILKLQTLKQKSKHLYFTLYKYVRLNIKKILPFMSMNFEEKLFSKSEKIYEKELDFIEILKKLQEIEKIKKILLNSNQQKLFNFLMKPVLYLDIANNNFKKKNKRKFSIHLNTDNNDEMQEDMENLKEVLDEYEKMQLKGVLSDVDQRIMMIIDKQTSNLAKYGEDSPTPKINAKNGWKFV